LSDKLSLTGRRKGVFLQPDMTLTDYNKAKSAAESTLVACWVAYCDQPDEDTLTYYRHLQRRLELAALYAGDVNYLAAVEILPPLPYTRHTTSANYGF
jgi:hypothetical protein